MVRTGAGIFSQLLTVMLLTSSSAVAGPASASSLVRVSGESPFTGCTADGGQSGVNYPNSELEPQAAVNPLDPLNVAVIAQQDRWSNSASRGVVVRVTKDGGGTWSEVAVPGLTKCAGGPYDRASNPWLSFAPDGVLYASALVFDNEPSTSEILASRSEDGGLTWGAPVPVTTDMTGELNDKPSITADPQRPGYAYVVWQRISSSSGHFARTTDGGATWDTHRRLTTITMMGAETVVLPDGSLVVVGGQFSGKRGSTITAVRSTDAGQTWSAGIQVTKLTPAPVTDPQTRDKIRTAGTWNMPDLAMDANPSSPGYGNLYVTWEDGRFSGRTKTAASALSMSSDGGRTWSTPVKVNRTPITIPAANQQAFTPTAAVASDGIVLVSYYDFRNNTSDAATLWTDRWVAHCHPSSGPSACASAANWSVNGEIRLTDSSFDHGQAPFANGYFLGDYQSLAAAGSDVIAAFAASVGDPADVFFRRIALS